MKKPNILFFFSDQQRYDSLGCNGQSLDVTPTLDKMAARGINFKMAYTIQPVCGPARAALQTGLYPAALGCFRNGISLPRNQKTLAARLKQAGYKVAYVGKWHLASDNGGADYRKEAVPLERRGGYDDYWVASDILEFTSHGYGGYLHDKDNKRLEFTGYRVNCVTDYALDYLDQCGKDEPRPFFLMVSFIEPHHQNDHNRFEGPRGSRERFAGFIPPPELQKGEGDWESQYPDYLGCCRALDDNLGRMIAKLKERGLYDDTVIIYSSDHGCHFRTHAGDVVEGGFDDYKRSCYENTIHIPMVFTGPAFRGEKECHNIVELIDIPKTVAAIAEADTEGMQGADLREVMAGRSTKEEAYIQISESYLGRALRTKQYTYCIYSPKLNPNKYAYADEYQERFLFDNKEDPLQSRNLIGDPGLSSLRSCLAKRLKERAREAGEPDFTILPAHSAPKTTLPVFPGPSSLCGRDPRFCLP
jgi:uncharacterized sulfatase